MAMVLVFFLVWLFRRRDGDIAVALILHLVTMVAPQVFRPIAVVWFAAILLFVLLPRLAFRRRDKLEF